MRLLSSLIASKLGFFKEPFFVFGPGQAVLDAIATLYYISEYCYFISE